MARAARDAARPVRGAQRQPFRPSESRLRRRLRRVGEWIADNLLAATTLTGVVIYGIERAALASFYGQLGLDPEDVGLTYSATLSRAIVGFLVFGIIAFLVGIGLGVLGVSLWRLQSSAAAARTFVVLGGGVVAIYLLLTITSYDLMNRIKHGHEITFLNPLGIRVDEVDLDWPGTKPDVLRHCDDCTILYLGRANGTAVFYDSEHQRTLRLPDTELRFRTQHAEPDELGKNIEWVETHEPTEWLKAPFVWLKARFD